ncbi:hypothetical protein [Nocardia sp. NPDC004604]|uniref:hypothetical protein n=1 Tax=Nocardia sp. NPDC004604 TaxID=3157013 RepID=UPI0033BE024E
MFVNGGAGGRKSAESNEERKDYFRYLDQLRKSPQDRRGATGAIGVESSRTCDKRSLVGTRPVWERRPTDPDFGHAHIGVGSRCIATELARPETGPLEVARYLTKRLPGIGITPQQLCERSWWTDHEVYIVVDDYDMVASNNPLLDLLPQASDIGLHVIIARRAGGASRALYDPVLCPLADLSVDALLMSASTDEGVLVGRGKVDEAPARTRHVGLAQP